jgi:hypothetical protein
VFGGAFSLVDTPTSFGPDKAVSLDWAREGVEIAATDNNPLTIRPQQIARIFMFASMHAPRSKWTGLAKNVAAAVQCA